LYVLHVVAPLGPWAVFAIAFVDSAAIPIPMDALIATYVYQRPTIFWIIVFPILGGLGSAFGSLFIYYIGRKGGEVALAKRVSQAKIDHLRATFEKREFLALMVPSILPPPTPFKLFVFSAGVFCMKVRDFLFAVTVGRFIRFLILAILTVRFGPQIVDIASTLFTRHKWAAIGGIVVVCLIAYLLIRAWKEPVEELAHDLEEHEEVAEAK
jgi:membrane protein YqaA with SNARE-associated domain